MMTTNVLTEDPNLVNGLPPNPWPASATTTLAANQAAMLQIGPTNVLITNSTNESITVQVSVYGPASLPSAKATSTSGVEVEAYPIPGGIFISYKQELINGLPAPKPSNLNRISQKV